MANCSVDSWNQAGKYAIFRFEAKWLLKENFMMLVQRTLREFIIGSYAYQLSRKNQNSQKINRVLEKISYNSVSNCKTV